MKRTINEKGQSLVIIAIAFFGLIAIAALAIDGGVLYLNRRNAQTAADAAAMAGARELCVNDGSTSDVENVVNNYAITENGATAVDDIVIDEANLSVTVITRIETASFFAQLIGFENNTAQAVAEAGCFPPGKVSDMLPIAWACQPPVGSNATDVCGVHYIPWDAFKQSYTATPPFDFINNILTDGVGTDYATYADNVGGKMAYIILDSSNSPNTYCMPPFGIGTIDCDMDGDNRLNVNFGSNRGWLCFDDGACSANQLINYMQNGLQGSVALPKWLPGKNGVVNNGFSKVMLNTPLYVPIFNAICPNTNVGALGSCTGWEPNDEYVQISGNHTFYRIPTFATFVVTCVYKKNSDKCPARNYFLASYVNDPNWKNVASIEGYFISGYAPEMDIDPDGSHMGVYIISLTK